MECKVKVRIYGQDYTIAGDRAEEEIREVAACVDETMREVGKHFTTNAQGSLGVLAAINIADELFEAKRKVAELEESVKNRVYVTKGVGGSKIKIEHSL